MIRKVLFVLVILLLMFPVGCSKSSNINTVKEPDKQEVELKDKTTLVYVYIQAIDNLLKEDPALNDGMKYIAIDMKTLRGISEADKEEIIKYFESKYTKVKDASMEDLKKEGEFDEKNYRLKNGVAIKVDKVTEFSDKSISFEASKYKSGLGAIGLEFNFTKQEKEWKLESSGMKWIS